MKTYILKIKSDILFNYIGNFGTYQIIIFLMSRYYVLFDTSLAYNFIAYRNNYWCDIPELAHLSHEKQSIIASPDGGNDQCNIYDFDYGSLTEEEIRNWAGVPNGTPTKKCQSWTYDTSEFWRTIVTEASLNTLC